MMRAPQVRALGDPGGLPVITIASLIAWRRVHDRVSEVARTYLPTTRGRFETVGYHDRLTGEDHLLLISPHGLGSPDRPPLIRLHSECVTGEVFGSQRCDCGPQLDRALERIGREPGAVVYLRGHEGRGVGLLPKLQAYDLQDQGLDTVDAQLTLGLPVDDREYGAAAGILHTLGVTRVRLLTNNPDKTGSLTASGIDVASIEPSETPPTPANLSYLQTKRDRLGHTLTLDQKNEH